MNGSLWELLSSMSRTPEMTGRAEAGSEARARSQSRWMAHIERLPEPRHGKRRGPRSSTPCARGTILVVLHGMDSVACSYIVACMIFLPTHVTLQPLFDEDSAVHRYFPAREWAIRIPASILITGISAVGFFTAKMMLGGQLSRRKHGVVDCNQSHHSN